MNNQVKVTKEIESQPTCIGTISCNQSEKNQTITLEVYLTLLPEQCEGSLVCLMDSLNPQTASIISLISLQCIQVLRDKSDCNAGQGSYQGSQQIFKQEVITDKVGGSSAKPEVSKQSKEKRLKHKVSGYKSQSKWRSIAGCRLLLRTLSYEQKKIRRPTRLKEKRSLANYKIILYV